MPVTSRTLYSASVCARDCFASNCEIDSFYSSDLRARRVKHVVKAFSSGAEEWQMSLKNASDMVMSPTSLLTHVGLAHGFVRTWQELPRLLYLQGKTATRSTRRRSFWTMCGACLVLLAGVEFTRAVWAREGGDAASGAGDSTQMKAR